VIDSHGGDVVKFAGDALLALWTAADPDAKTGAVWRAAYCAHERADAVDAASSLQRLRRFARVFPFAGPRASFLAGRIAQIRGRRAQALEHWRSGARPAAR